MMKNLFVLLSFVLISVAVCAQSAVVPAGGTATGAGGTVTYTVGQPAVKTIGNSAITVSEGVQQPYEISVVGIDEHPEIVLSAKLYPNPTPDRTYLQLAIDDEQFAGDIRIFDDHGKYISMLKIEGPVTEIDLSEYASGTYFVRVANHRKAVKTFKVVKIQQY